MGWKWAEIKARQATPTDSMESLTQLVAVEVSATILVVLLEDALCTKDMHSDNVANKRIRLNRLSYLPQTEVAPQFLKLIVAQFARAVSLGVG